MLGSSASLRKERKCRARPLCEELNQCSLPRNCRAGKVVRLRRLSGVGEPWPRGSIAADAVGQPGRGCQHSEPAEGAHDSADFLVLREEAPLGEENFPVGVAGANQRQGCGTRIGHVGADVGEVLEEPEAGKSKAGGFPLPEEINGAPERHQQFAEGSAEDHDGVSEPTEKEMPALVDDQIDEIEEQESGVVRKSVEEK